MQDAMEIERRALDARLAISSYQIHTEYHVPVNGFECSWKSASYYREGDKVRVDYERAYTPEQVFPGLNASTFDTRKILTPNHTYTFGTQEFPDGQVETCQISREPDEVQKKYADTLELDIRSIGFHACGAWVNKPIDDLLRNLGGLDRIVEEDEINGIKCFKIMFNVSDKANCEIWIAPSQGYSPLRCVMHFPEWNMTDKTDVVVSEWNESGLWFPVSSSFTRNIGEQVIHQEDCKITVASLNQPLPPNTFELSGLGMTPGTHVISVPDIRPQQLWDGKEIVEPVTRYQTEVAKSLSAGWIIFINATALIIILLFFTIRHFKHRLITT